MNLKAIKTRKFLPPKDDLADLLSVIDNLEENSVIALASKVVSISEGRCIPISKVSNKDELITSESDFYLPREFVPGGRLIHTITNNILIGTAGIDESNANNHFILWPKNPAKSAQQIWEFLTKKYKIKNLGVVITDSHSVPLHRGLVGISLGFYGFEPLFDYRGKTDLFGRQLYVSMTNLPDSLAAAAVLQMGEGDEQTPIVIITDIPYINFTTLQEQANKPYSSFEVPMEEDLFQPILTSVPWKKGGRK